MRARLRFPSPALVIAVVALVAAVGGGYAIGAGKVKTKNIANKAVTTKKIANQAVTNEKIAIGTIKGDRVDEASLSGTGTAQSKATDVAAQVNAASGLTTVLSLQVPAGSYVLSSKAVLAQGGAATLFNCVLAAEADGDTAIASVGPTTSHTINNQLAHTFASGGTATLSCDNPTAQTLFVMNRSIIATPVGAINTQ